MRPNSSFHIHQLLQQISQGDEFAFRQLFDQYKEQFYSTAFKMTHSTAHAEDVVQATFVAVWEKRELVAAAEKPEAYLFGILKNCIYAHFRVIVNDRKVMQAAVQHEEDYEMSSEVLLVEKERRSVLDAVITHLPNQQRLVYQLAKRDGMSRNEIAKRLNISPNTVRNHLSAAIESLHDWFRINKSALGWIIIVFFM